MDDVTLKVYIISRMTHSYYARELSALGITMAQFPYIMAITENDGISQENLSRKLRVGKSTTAEVIRQLVVSGLVSREVDPADRRNLKLHATGRALQLKPQIQLVIDRCNKLLVSDLSEEEKEQFSRILSLVRSQAEKLPGMKGGKVDK